MSCRNKEIVFLILQFLDEEKFKETVHKLEQESGFFFNMKYFEDEVRNGNWDEVERYLSGFTKADDNLYSMKMFDEIRKQKYKEGLDKYLKAVETSQFLKSSNFREKEKHSKYGDTKSSRTIMLVELKKLIQENPLFHEKLQFPNLDKSRLQTLIDQSLNWQHQLCKNPRPNPDIKTLFVDHTCAQPHFDLAPSPANNPPLLGSIPKAGGLHSSGAHGKIRKTDDTPKGKEKKDSHESKNESEEENEENENGVLDDSEDKVADPSGSKEKDDDLEEEMGRQKQSSTKSSAKKEALDKAVSKKTATPKNATAINSPKKASKRSSFKQSKVISRDTTPNVSSRKKREVERNKRKYSSLTEFTTKEKASMEKAGKNVSGAKEKSKDSVPSEAELANTISDILKEIDFSTATFSDIIKRLARHYGVDLTHKKQVIKLLIHEELTKLEFDEEEREEEGDPEPAAQNIKT